MWSIGFLALAAALGLVLWQRRKNRKLLEKLKEMLERAMEGDFTEEDYDESLLSSLETKLAHYLAASTNSARKVQKEKDKLKSLVSDISHQTKTPLSNLLLYTQLLKEQSLPLESRECVSALETQTEKLQALLDALVKTARLESGVLALQPQEGELSPMIEAALVQIAPWALQKNMRLCTGDLAGRATFDPRWTEEALFNVLDNGVKYAPAGSEIRIEVKEYPLFTAIQISDQGPGIPEEDQAKVFQRFYRGAGQEKEEGVGLGLYLLRQILEGQGGYVKLSSRPGEGSCFSLYLPR